MHKKLSYIKCLLVAVFLTASLPTHADFQAGWKASEAGDYATALKEYKPLAEQGDAYAQHNLGLMYGNGQGVPQDDKEAVKWYRLAAEQGHSMAQNNLGWKYALGEGGVPQDDKEAVKWYRLAAEQGNAVAQNNLGEMYENGRGVPQDHLKARNWYWKAAVQRDADAQNNLARMYRTGSHINIKGEGVPQDDKEAGKSYHKAAEQGDADAQAYMEKKKLVIDIQAQLQTLGYDPGPVDGLAGKRTQDAVRAFQRDEGIHPNGVLSPILTSYLKKAYQKRLRGQQDATEEPTTTYTGKSFGKGGSSNVKDQLLESFFGGLAGMLGLAIVVGLGAFVIYLGRFIINRLIQNAKTKNNVNPQHPAAIAWEEVEAGNTDKATWSRAFFESGGDYQRTKARYIELRVGEIGELNQGIVNFQEGGSHATKKSAGVEVDSAVKNKDSIENGGVKIEHKQGAPYDWRAAKKNMPPTENGINGLTNFIVSFLSALIAALIVRIGLEIAGFQQRHNPFIATMVGVAVFFYARGAVNKRRGRK